MIYEGEIQDIHLVERLIQLWREQFTGAIRFEHDGIIKIIYFKGGDILSASTNDRADSVDEILMRAGKVTKEHVKQALAKRKENETLGDALLNLGFITRKELSWARRVQAINVIRSIEAWEGGSYTVVADYLPKREEGTIFPLPQVIVEMVVTDQDRGKFERLLDSGMIVFEKAPGQDDTFRKLGLNEDAEAVMEHVDGEKSATEVAASSRQETFNAFKLLHALSLLGILRKRGPAEAGATGFESAGVADAADVWGGGDSAQFTLGDEPSPSFGTSDDFAPVPGLADPLIADSMPAVPEEPPAPQEPTPAWEAAPMPSWDEPPRAASPISAPAPEPPAEPAEERRWGFDEAQIEAAQKAIQPPAAALPDRGRARIGSEGTMTRRKAAAAPPKKKKQDRQRWLAGAAILLLVAAAGFFGFRWWQGRAAGEAEVAQAATQTPPPAAVATTATAAPVVTGTTPPPAVETAPAPVADATPPPQPVPQPVAQPPAAAPAPAGSERARYESMARTFAENPRGNFTVQFAIVCEPSNVTTALRAASGRDVWFIPITLKGRFCFRMFWGGFETRAEAERAFPQLPGELRESNAAVVTVPR